MILCYALAFGLFVAAYARLVPTWCDGTPWGIGLAVVLALAGLVLGGLTGKRMKRNGANHDAWAAAVFILLWAWLALSPFLMPAAIASHLLTFGGRMPTFGRFVLWQAGLLSRVLFPAGLLAGFGGALLWRLKARGSGSYSRLNPGFLNPASWRQTVLATFGLLVGAAVAWLWLTPVAGVVTTLRAGALIGALATVPALWRRLPRHPRALRLVAWLPLVLAAAFALTFRHPAPLLSQQPIGCWLATQGATSTMPGTIVAHDDGRRQALTLRRLPSDEWLLCGDGERRFAHPSDLPGAVLAVQVPLLLHADPHRLALLGLDSGAALAAATDHPLTRIECAGIEPRQLPLLRQTLAEKGDAETAFDDSRVSFATQSPLRLLRQGPGRYDVIVVQPDPLWTLNGSRLVSRGAFSACRRALSTNGILCVSLDTQALGPKQMKRITGDFAAVFPQMQLWSPQFNRYLLIGTAGTPTFDAAHLLAGLERRLVMRRLARVGVRALPDLLACLVMEPANVRLYLGDPVERSLRDRCGIAQACRAARGRLTPERNRLMLAQIETARTWRLDTLQAGELDPDLFEALRSRAQRQMGARAALMELRVNREASATRATAIKQARAAAKLNAEDAFLNRLLLAMEQEASHALARADYASAARLYGDVLGVVPERASARYGAAMADRGLGHLETAYRNLTRAVAAEPGETTCRLALAEVAFELGREEEALSQYQTLLDQRVNDPETLIGLAVCLGRSKPPIRNVKQALAAAERAAQLTRYRNRRINGILADLYIENGRVVEGVSLKRRIRLAGKE